MAAKGPMYIKCSKSNKAWCVPGKGVLRWCKISAFMVGWSAVNATIKHALLKYLEDFQILALLWCKMMFGRSEKVHRFITVVDQEEKSKGIGEITGRDTLALMHWDVINDVRGMVKSRLKCRLQEAGTSLDFQKGFLDFIEGYYCSVNLLNSAWLQLIER